MLAINGVGFDWSDMAEEQVQTNMALWLLQTLRGLDTVEAQLVTYRKNEVLFSEEVDVLKREVGCKQYEINMLKTEFEKVKQEKDGIEFKIEKFDKASKDLDQLLESQITDKSKMGLGYSAVSDNEDEVESPDVVEKKTIVPTIPKVDVVRPKQQEKLVRKIVRYVEMYRSKGPRGDQRNWNNLKSQQLGNDFVMHNKACYIVNIACTKCQCYAVRMNRVNAVMISMLGLETKNEVLFSEEVVVLKREVGIKQYEVNTLKTEFEKLKQEKDAINFKIEKFVPPPHPLIYNRPNKLDLSYSGLEEFQQHEFEGYGLRANKSVCENSSNETKKNSLYLVRLGLVVVMYLRRLNVLHNWYQSQVALDLGSTRFMYRICEEKGEETIQKNPLLTRKRWPFQTQRQQPKFEGYGLRANKSVCENSSNETKKNSDAPLIEEWVSDNEDVVESPVVVKKKTVFPTPAKIEFVRPKQHEKSVRKPVKYAEMYRSQRPRGNQRNWNNQKSQQLGSDFVVNNKACFVCGSFDHLKKDYGKRIIKPVWKNTRRVDDHYSTRMTHSNPRRNMIPQAVLMRSGIKAVNTAKPKDAHNAVKRNIFNTIKASACWVWMPKNRVIDHVSKNNKEDDLEDSSKYGRNNAQIDEDHFGSDGCTDSGEVGVQQRQKIMMKGKGFPEQKVNHKFRGGLLGVKLSALSTAKSKVSTAHKLQLYYCRFKITAAGEKVNAVSTS
ncbi:hypothetical protein Tco_0247431 [Tanacetum coccineum]